MNDAADDAEHDRLRSLLGAYALGALGAEERALVDVHLAGCADCRADLADIAPAAEALADLRSAGVRPVGDPPAGLADRVLAGVEHERRRDRRSRWVRGAGVGAVAAAVLGVVLVGGLRLTAPDPAPVVPLEAVPVTTQDDAVRASADLVPHTWGVEVKLRASGFTAGERYVVTVQGADGKDHAAGEFVGTGAKEMDCNLNSSVLRDAAVGFEVRDADGDVLVTSSF